MQNDRGGYLLSTRNCKQWLEPLRFRKCTDSKLLSAKRKSITNFKEHLPAPQSKLAQETLKAPYNIDFLTMCEDYDKRNLDTAVDKLLKQEEDNPTIGLLICKTKR